MIGKRLTTREFIERSEKIHGNRYDYNRVKYKNMSSPVVIICKNHGEFKQLPSNHIKGRGCRKCSDDIFRMGLEEFIKKSIKIHGNKYDYSRVKYKNNRTKVCIICKKHGEFWQNPEAHYRLEYGCPVCDGTILFITEEFVEKAKEIHNDMYSYEKTKYKNHSTKVIITCKDHGNFSQTPSHHLGGTKCPKCANNQQMTQKDFLEKARKIHGDKYDYSKIQYKHIKHKGIIICLRHGEFEQKLDNHLCGKGCPHCLYKSEGKVKELLLKYFKDWNIILNKKLWDIYKNYDHKRYCDFWLEKDGVKLMVEYDGEQHFSPVSFGCKDKIKVVKNFKHTQLKDKLDSKFCKENNVLLHRIRYDEDKEESIKELRNSL